jgi:heme/copper-type cytochrome/quinol oxidase subunit 1
VIGFQYAGTSLCFLLVGFSLVVLIRWQLAYPGLPAMGIVAEIIANNTRKPLCGYRLMVYA